jgi:hypothetical protein
MTTAKIIMLAVLAASQPAQTKASNIGPTPPPRVNDDLSVAYFLSAPNAKEVLLADTAVSPGPPLRPLSKGDDGMWSVTTPPYEPGTHYYGFLIDGVLTGDLGGTAVTDRLSRGFLKHRDQSGLRLAQSPNRLYPRVRGFFAGIRSINRLDHHLYFRSRICSGARSTLTTTTCSTLGPPNGSPRCPPPD